MHFVRYLPIELDVAGEEALCLGTSAELANKVERLLQAGARVVVIASGSIHEDLNAQIQAHQDDGRITLQRRDAQASDLEGKRVVFVATNEAERFAPLVAIAKQQGRLVCTLDRPELSTFVNPAMAHVQGLTMTFATGGISPSVVRTIRQNLEAIFADPRFGRFLRALGDLRQKLPRGARAERMAQAVSGFRLEGSLRFPAWLGPDEPEKPNRS